MKGTIIENISDRKLLKIVLVLIFAQVIFFVLPVFVAPDSVTKTQLLGVDCNYGSEIIFQFDREKIISNPDGLVRDHFGYCYQLVRNEVEHYYRHQGATTHVIYVFQWPSDSGKVVVEHSKWQRSSLGHLTFTYDNFRGPRGSFNITLTCKFAYKNEDDNEDEWTLYDSLQTNLTFGRKHRVENRRYTISTPLLQYEAGYKDSYVLNIQIAYTQFAPDLHDYERKKMTNQPALTLSLTTPNRMFTNLLLCLKTGFLPIIVSFTVWHWLRMRQHPKSVTLLNSSLIFMAITISLCNLPLELLTLRYRMVFMLYLKDVRMNVFYVGFSTFWITFISEHVIRPKDQKKSVRVCWSNLGVVAIGCAALCLVHIRARNINVDFPFSPLWASDLTDKLVVSFIMSLTVTAILYSLMIAVKVSHVFRSLNASMAMVPRLATAPTAVLSPKIAFRTKSAMIAAVICVVITAAEFILCELAGTEEILGKAFVFSVSTCLAGGVYAMWNIYTVGLLFLYAPADSPTPPTPARSSQHQDSDEASSGSLSAAYDGPSGFTEANVLPGTSKPLHDQTQSEV